MRHFRLQPCNGRPSIPKIDPRSSCLHPQSQREMACLTYCNDTASAVGRGFRRCRSEKRKRRRLILAQGHTVRQKCAIMRHFWPPRRLRSARRPARRARGRAGRPRPARGRCQALRRKLGMSQSRFARSFGFGLAAVQGREQRHRPPEGPARVPLKVIEHEPEAVRRALAA